jgi:hypothetical protein
MRGVLDEKTAQSLIKKYAEKAEAFLAQPV